MVTASLGVFEDEVGGDPGDRHLGGLGVAGDLDGQDGGVDDAQPGHAADTQLGVDDIVDVLGAWRWRRRRGRCSGSRGG
jgi:hypothetical protein